MLLLRNENASPDIKSFQATVRHVLNKYTREANKQKDKDATILPHAIVNIVDMPLKEDIQAVLKNVKKIKWVKLNFFRRLNNDFDQQPVASSIRAEMERIGSDTTNIQFNSPDSKAGIQKLLEETSGLARTTLFVSNEDGEDEKIREDTFTSNKKIPFSRDITGEDDEHLVSIAKKQEIMNTSSKENIAWYEKFATIIRSLT